MSQCSSVSCTHTCWCYSDLNVCQHACMFISLNYRLLHCPGHLFCPSPCLSFRFSSNGFVVFRYSLFCFFPFSRSLDILMDARLIWLSVMVLLMVKRTTFSCFFISPLAILLNKKYTYPNTELVFFQVDLQLPDCMTWMNLFSRSSFWQ